MKKAFASIMIMVAMAAITGCLTSATAYTKRTTAKDGTTTIESNVRIIGTGDKASEVAAEGLFADGADDDLGAGVKKAQASQQSTGIEGTLNGLGGLMTGMAKFMATAQGLKVSQSADLSSSEGTGESVSSAAMPTVSTAASSLSAAAVASNAVTLAAKLTEAKTSGKPLVVIAGNTGCGYCKRLDSILDAAPEWTASTNMVLYRETSPWATNQAGKWTGGGAFPVVRITQWDTNGVVVCDEKINRPQTIAAIEAELNTCSSPK